MPPAPAWLDEHGGWPQATIDAWADLWTTPQATAWDQSGRTLHEWCGLHAAQHFEATPARAAEKRQHEDRHGLNPKALLGLRWRIDKPAEVATPTMAPNARRSSRNAKVLQLVTNSGPAEV